MRILELENKPFHQINYSSATGNGGAVVKSLPFIRGTVDRLPANVDAVFISSDLQGVVDWRIDGRTEPQQLGISVAECMFELAVEEKVPPTERTAAVLCGDLYTMPTLEKRGGTGDARPVWLAFGQYFSWVVGVAGNHDSFGATDLDVRQFVAQPSLHLLDGTVFDAGGVVFAGIGGIIGDASKPLRRSEKEFSRLLKELITRKPDVLLLHQGPDVPDKDLPGHEAVRKAIHRGGVPLVACGHVHWNNPLAELPDGTQVINVDTYALILTVKG